MRTSRISAQTDDRPSCAVVVFAHNEAAHIRQALTAVARGVDDTSTIEVWVLANGCSDQTSEEVRACAALLRNLWLVEIPLGDKANAWNVYVHEIAAAQHRQVVDTHVFTDGDVAIEPGAIAQLMASMRQNSSVLAVGGMPASGRDKAGWRQRMVENGLLAGNLYALSGRFLEAVRSQGIRLPVGIVGEDFVVSWLVDLVQVPGVAGRTRRMMFCPSAEFSFRSLSPLRPADWRTYARRKWRYTRRALELEMLLHVLRRGGLDAMPPDVTHLYRHGPLPSRLKWDGLDTPLRLAAVLGIRRFRRRA